ncbi:MAG: diguanylate cyclase [Acidobacteria bacterium]|nr:diguanylate cyclase [Acidobacteriota bacterium]MBV9476607.1 diguanylate cyclase [Acidobacteriota bacterium]
MPQRLLGICIAAALLCSTALSASEAGYPSLTIYRQEQHHGGTQNFAAAIDARGRLYFSNLETVLIYDGAWWSRVDVPGNVSFSVLATPRGVVGVGPVDEIGILEPNAHGTLAYRSLVPLLPPDLRANIDQPQLCVFQNDLIFAARHFIARWDGQRLRVLERHPDGKRTRHCEEINGQLYVGAFDGLKVLGGPSFLTAKRIDAVLAPDRIIVRNEGFVHANGTPYQDEASVWLRGKGVMRAQHLHDGRWAIATLRYGLLLMQPDGRIDQIIDASTGLPEVFLYDIVEDQEGALWLAMDNAIVRVDAGSPATVLDRRVDLPGSLQAVTRHNGRLYAGTQHGIYAIDATPSGARARKLPGLDVDNANPWVLLSTNGDLLAGAYGGIYVVHDDRPAELIAGTKEETIFDLAPSHSDPALVWTGGESGVGRLRHTASGWMFEGIVPNTPPHVRSVGDAHGTAWAASESDGLVRIESNGRVTAYGKGLARVMRSGDEVVLSVNGRFVLADANGALHPDPRLASIQLPNSNFFAGVDAAGDLWLATRPPRVVRLIDAHTYESEAHAIGTLEGDIETFYADADGINWLGTERGLYRVAPSATHGRTTQPAPLIHRVVDGNDRVLFDGNVNGAHAPVTLRHAFGRVRIEIAPLSSRAETEYQYRLDPIDQDWTPWTSQAFLDFTNLGADDYTFRVRTRGARGAISSEARWSFRVLAPWYATWWALALWTLVGAVLVVAFIQIRTRTLRRNARVLQQRVEEQTVLLRRANERLEALSLVDDLTGVANRRFFDRALLDEWKRAERRGDPLSLIMVDLDHFKDVNDSRGHAAGDECLRRVAQHIGGIVRGSGDVVARWGGEEFVILLPGADVSTASAIAERLRAGIAASCEVTASFGVAARSAADDPSSLIDRADRALYAAKRDGRNVVRSDEGDDRERLRRAGTAGSA